MCHAQEEAAMMVAKRAVLCALLVCAGISFVAVNVAAVEEMASAPVVSLKEMPLLRGVMWLKMTQDEKVAFVWGIGHVVTMERERMGAFPEMKKESFAAKMAEGLAGIPMNNVVGAVDGFYTEHPNDVAEPVVKVMWIKFVEPKIVVNGTSPSAEK